MFRADLLVPKPNAGSKIKPDTYHASGRRWKSGSSGTGHRRRSNLRRPGTCALVRLRDVLQELVQFARMKGLHESIIEAGGNCRFHMFFFAQTCHGSENRLREARPLSEPSSELAAIDPGHSNVGQDHVGLEFL